MSIIKEIITLSLCLVLSAQTHTASRFHKVAKFITAPSMLLGASASAYKYKLREERREWTIKHYKKEAELQEWYYPFKNQKSIKKEVRKICGVHGLKNPTIVLCLYDGNFSSRHNNEYIIGINVASNLVVSEFSTGHECTHIRKNDTRARSIVNSLQPLIISSLYKGSKTLGASKKLSALCAASGLLSHSFISAKISQEQEYRCDRESSQNPEVLEFGAQSFDKHSLAQKEAMKRLRKDCIAAAQSRLEELDQKIQRHLLKDLNEKYQSLDNNYGSKLAERLAHYTVEAEELFADHPPSDLRAQRLRNQAQTIKKDIEKKRIEAKYACFSNSQ